MLGHTFAERAGKRKGTGGESKNSLIRWQMKCSKVHMVGESMFPGLWLEDLCILWSFTDGLDRCGQLKCR
jgi:hypothetical protein